MERNRVDGEQRQKPSTLRPEIREKCLQLIGLAARARRVAIGSDAALAAISDKTAQLVFVAVDAGTNGQKKYRDKCAFYHISLVEEFTRDELGHACGRHQCVVMAVTDPGFAAKMMQFVGESVGGEAFDETSSI